MGFGAFVSVWKNFKKARCGWCISCGSVRNAFYAESAMTTGSIPHGGEAETFHLWFFRTPMLHVDRAVSSAIRNGMGFVPPAGYPESLAAALRQSEEGGELGGPPFRWDVALDLGDNAGLWDFPDDEQGLEFVRQSVPRQDLPDRLS